MKLINRKSVEVKYLNRRSVQRFYVSVDGRQIYFTVAASVHCGLYKGGYMHFMNQDDVWQFYVNDDPDGFPLVETLRTGRDASGYKVCHSGLVAMILKSTGFKNKKRFSIVYTGVEQDRSKIFTLSTENVTKNVN